MQPREVLGTVIGLLSFAVSAGADTEVHAGLDLRTDQRAHLARIELGFRRQQIEASLVLDPLVFADGEHDGDLVFEWHRCDGAVALLTGWRTTSVALAEGHQWYESSLVGVTTSLHRGRTFDAKFGAELLVLWFKHGGDLPTTWIARDRSIGDHIHIGLFVRIDHAFPI